MLRVAEAASRPRRERKPRRAVSSSNFDKSPAFENNFDLADSTGYSLSPAPTNYSTQQGESASFGHCVRLREWVGGEAGSILCGWVEFMKWVGGGLESLWLCVVESNWDTKPLLIGSLYQLVRHSYYVGYVCRYSYCRVSYPYVCGALLDL